MDCRYQTYKVVVDETVDVATLRHTQQGWFCVFLGSHVLPYTPGPECASATREEAIRYLCRIVGLSCESVSVEYGTACEMPNG